MKIRYLVTKDELELLFLLYDRGFAGGEQAWNLKNEKASLSLHEKGYLYEKNGTIYLENLILAFLDIMRNAEEIIDFQEGRLYFHSKLMIWVASDQRRKDGLVLTPYPDIFKWYEEEFPFLFPEPGAAQLKQIKNWMEKEIK